MPLKTRYYNLEAFRTGDVYSSRIDQRRFTIIDNEMAFIADQIGSGLVFGWDIIDNEDGTISISPGMGLINRRIVQSFGGIDVILSNNTIHYLSMEAKDGVVGGLSGNSNIVNAAGNDSIPPSSPSGLQKEDSILDYLASLPSYTDDFINYLRNIMDRKNKEDSLELIPYKEVAFSWDANTEPDFSYYSIKKLVSLDGDISGEAFKEVFVTTELIYVNIDLDQNISYDYQVVAIDLSGNESNASSISISTDIDSRIPAPPIFVQVFPGNENLQVVWDNSPSENVPTYRVVVQPLDGDYNTDGTPTVTNVTSEESTGFNSTYVFFENIINNKNYDITVYSISSAGNFSEGITVRSLLRDNLSAGEVNNIDVDFTASTFENVGLETTVKWRYEQEDPYLQFAEKFIITFVENGIRFSDTIEVLESVSRQNSCPDGDDSQGFCYELNIKYIPYNVNDILVHESIKEYTPYMVIIQTEDSDGDLSNGSIIRISKTPVVNLVSSVSNFNIEQQNDNSIFLSWDNPEETYFSHNLLTINILDLGSTDSEGTNYVENLRIDKADTYTIPSSLFSTNFRYTTQIVPYDTFGTEGNGFGDVSQFVDEENILRPSPPTSLKLDLGDTELYLKWNKQLEGEFIEFYRIYRAVFSLYQRSSAFQDIATIPSSMIDFIDYTVTNGVSYSYFVTSIDIYGNESLNPVDDGHISTNTVSGTSSQSLSLDPPEGLVINVNSNQSDSELSWEVSAGDFDGYEILKSVGNNYSFEVLDYVSFSEISYIDEDALLKSDEEYYYMVRKFRNDVVLNVKSSSSLNDNSISIGKVTTTEGVSNVSIDLTSVVNIENLEDPLTDKTNDAIDIHHHTNDEGIDKRIELRSNVNISDWTTLDYQVYSTAEDIEGAVNYFLQVTGTLNEAYFTDGEGNIDVARLRQAQSGESPILFDIDGTNDRLIFEEQLFSSQGSFVAPYLDAPVLSLELVGISEVDNLLPSVNVQDVSASQFKSGLFEFTQMPNVNHDGRKTEKLLPLKLPMRTLDNFVYSLASNYEDIGRNLVGTSVAFYDIISIDGDRILAATSNGIWLSNNYGNDWEQVATFSVSIRKLYKSLDEEYYALTNYGVYKKEGTSFRTWNLMSGLEFVKVVRDIAEDGSGNLYVTTDLGVFKLNSEFVPFIEDTWQKMPIVGARSSEVYAIVYQGDYDRGSILGTGRILVSNEIGLIQSIDEGLTWNYVSDLEAFVKVRDFIIRDNYLFALSDNAIYREKNGNDTFINIAEIDSLVSKDIVIFDGDIYVTTSNGVKKSNSDDINRDTFIDFISVFSLMNIKNITVIATTIDIINNDIFVGTDKALYIQSSGNFWLQFEERETVIPSIYEDGVLQKLGFYYNNGGDSQNISFDEIRDTENSIELSNKYDMYQMEFGGWVYNKYDAKFKIYDNDILFGESRDEVDIDLNQFVSVVLPIYNDNNAHKVGADKYKASLEADLEIINSPDIPSGEDLVVLISDIYQQFELFLSQLYEEARVIIDTDGNTSNFILPSIITDIVVRRVSTSNEGEITFTEEPVYTTINIERGTSYTTSVNIVDGFFAFGLPFAKYDNLTVDIFDVTIKDAGENSHRELENVFEEAYSGAPSYLSQVQQINLVKLGLFSEKRYPGEIESLNPLVQSKNIIPVDDEWYDNLNSTINYTQEDSNGDVVSSINYPSAVLYIDETEKIMVGGKGLVLSIDKTSLDIEEVNVSSLDNQLVRSIFPSGGNIFVLTDNDIHISSDDGLTWKEYNRSGLPNNLYSIGSITNNLIIGAEDGVYIKLSDSDAIDWEKVKDSNTPVEIIYTSNILFLVIDRKIYISANGFAYTDTGVGEDLDIIDIDRQGFANTYVSTIQGLYSDNGTFNSLSPELQQIDLGELLEVGDTVNNTTTDDEKVVIGVSNGSYGLIKDGILNIKDNTSLDTIHKVLIIDDKEWLFGQDIFKVPFLDYPIKLTTGSPM